MPPPSSRAATCRPTAPGWAWGSRGAWGCSPTCARCAARCARVGGRRGAHRGVGCGPAALGRARGSRGAWGCAPTCARRQPHLRGASHLSKAQLQRGCWPAPCTITVQPGPSRGAHAGTRHAQNAQPTSTPRLVRPCPPRTPPTTGACWCAPIRTNRNPNPNPNPSPQPLVRADAHPSAPPTLQNCGYPTRTRLPAEGPPA